MKNSQFILFIAVVFIIGFVAIGSWLNETAECGQQADTLLKDAFRKSDSLRIKQIVIFKYYPHSEINLVEDSVTIRDEEQLLGIQRMLAKSKRRHKSHPISTWMARLDVTFVDNDHLILEVVKISNDSIKAMTYLSLAQKPCSSTNTWYSIELGSYLEYLVGHPNNTFE